MGQARAPGEIHTEAIQMLAVQVDFNEREVYADGDQAAAISFGPQENPPALERKLEGGLRVLLYDWEMRREGVVRPGDLYPWVADIVRGSIRDLAPGEFERLRAETLSAAEQSD